MQNCNSKFKSDLRERCYKLSLRVIALMDSLSTKQSIQMISKQLLRSSTSIGANLVEARAASSRLEFKRFYEISLKSANETKYWLALLQDSKLIDRRIVEPLLYETVEIANMLAKGVLSLKRRNF